MIFVMNSQLPCVTLSDQVVVETTMSSCSMTSCATLEQTLEICSELDLGLVVVKVVEEIALAQG
jgi:hypothetical protein